MYLNNIIATLYSGNIDQRNVFTHVPETFNMEGIMQNINLNVIRQVNDGPH